MAGKNLERKLNGLIKATGKRMIVWNQLVMNGNFAEGGDNPTNWTKGYGTTFDNSNPDEIICYGNNYAYQMPQNPLTVGHIYYLSARAKKLVLEKKPYFYCSYFGGSSLCHVNNDGSWTNIRYRGSAATTGETSSYGLIRLFLAGGELVVDKNCGINIFDLTMMFGAGNEPTMDEFDAMFDRPNTYYPYNAGEIMYI